MYVLFFWGNKKKFGYVNNLPSNSKYIYFGFKLKILPIWISSKVLTETLCAYPNL